LSPALRAPFTARDIKLCFIQQARIPNGRPKHKRCEGTKPPREDRKQECAKQGVEPDFTKKYTESLWKTFFIKNRLNQA
jgi:hypothetical protein